MKIIEYEGTNKIKVEFLDGNHYIAQTSYSAFKKGQVRNPNYRIGEISYNTEGFRIKIVRYVNASDLDVEFDDGLIVKSTYERFKSGRISRTNYDIKMQRLGEEKTNTRGSAMKIIEYNNSHDIVVQFQDEHKYTVRTDYSMFEKGYIWNPYHPIVGRVGFAGKKYKTLDDSGKEIKAFVCWKKMIERCYPSEKEIDKYKAYSDVSVCEEWFNFENYYEWITKEENYEIWKDIPQSAVDKDILVKKNRLYAPNVCCLVPLEINALFNTGSVDRRGPDVIGVYYNKWRDSYYATCSDGHQTIHLGEFPTSHQAFLKYKEFKEDLIKKYAEKYYAEGKISKKCYDAMMAYEVEEDD